MSDFDLRVLIFSLSHKDSQSSQKVLDLAHVPTLICSNISELCEEIKAGCGALVLAKEILDPNAIERINRTVTSQGKWSFIPAIVLVSGGDLQKNTKALELLKPLRNTTLLERPVRVSTFISVINASLADRKRQYDVRDLLEELERSKIDAEAANRAKSDFLANMSHEIRTPLGAMLGFADLLSEKNLSQGERKNYLQTIKRNGHLLSSLISDVLDLSKVESGKIDVEYLAISPKELVSEILAIHQPQAEKKRINIRIDVANDVSPIVVTDPLRLKQIISNIVGNAIKFTQHGEIGVKLSSKMSQDKKHLVIEVIDSGIGMSSEQSKRLFQPFTQADNSITRKYGGTGLGLTLSKRLAQILGGDLVLKRTEVDQGSTFEVTIDVSQQVRSSEFPLVHEEEITESMLAGCNVLVVDDSPDNQMLISHLVELSGATVEIASDGIEGVEKAMSEKFDVVLMDIQMPRLGGYEAIQRLRASLYKRPIIALTAYALKEEIDKCFEAGCDHYLTKPIHRTKLIQTISRCFKKPRSHEKFTQSVAQPTP